MKKALVLTLGCKVNQVESEAIKEDLKTRGYTIVRNIAEADLCIINTCSVTHVSDRKSRNLVRRVARANPRALLIVTGCLAELDPDQISAIEGVDFVVGTGAKESVVEIADASSAPRTNPSRICTGLPEYNRPLRTVLFQERHERSRAFIKISDGCQSFCSYCIVPYARGPLRSKATGEVVRELQCLVNLGYREIVLTGINIGHYGCDLKAGTRLADLLKILLEQVEGEYRLRLGSINPTEIDTALLGLIGSDRRICRHLHVPLQSGSDRVLNLMKRPYTSQEFRDLLMKISRDIPFTGLTTDVMVGFPGENEDDFESTYRLLEELAILDLHVFRYSRRPGTEAALIDDQVEDRFKDSRSSCLIDLAAAKKQAFLEEMLGQTWKVLEERSVGSGIYKAVSDNYVEFLYRAEKDRNGELLTVKAIHLDENNAIWASPEAENHF